MTDGEFLVDDLKKDIQIANNNAIKFKDKRIENMAERLKELHTTLVSYAETQNIKELKEYANTIFQRISWDNSELTQEEKDTNSDYKIFINRIYALLSENTMSYDISFTQDQYQKIHKYIMDF